MMKMLRKMFVPILIFLVGIDVLVSDPDKPYSSTVPIVLGDNREFIGGAILALAVFLALSVALHLRKERIQNTENEHSSNGPRRSP